jgi:hypothetical protein
MVESKSFPFSRSRVQGKELLSLAAEGAKATDFLKSHCNKG